MPDTSQASLVIRREDPRRRRLAWALAAAVAGALAALAFWWGYRAGVGDSPESQRHREVLTELQRAYAENGRLRERVAALERSEQVARNANHELRGEIGELQEELAAARSDLSLYQGLASAAGSADDGLGVHQLVVRPTAAPRVYDFTLTLLQNLEQAEPVRGRVGISVEGLQDGEPERLGLADMLASEEDGLDFAFKYFRLLDGTLTLPDGFAPGRVRVRLRPDGAPPDETVVADFEWSAVVKKAARHNTDTGAPGS